jgi:DNA-binding protein YbaB
MLVGGAIGWLITYMWANYRYNNKKEIDKCYKERSNCKQELELMKKENEELKENIKKLNKDLEQAHREITEKNKYLSEDKVIVERLYEVKQLSDKISDILIDYDKDTIQHLLSAYVEKHNEIEDDNYEEEKHNKKI